VAGKGGGAWKVAYADFVTAMMAFFLVMWIAGQDDKVKRAVGYYFQNPFANSEAGISKNAPRTGSVPEFKVAGSIPQSESIAMGRGRNSYNQRDEKSIATKLIGNWVFADKDASKYWREQTQRQRALAKESPEVLNKLETVDSFAIQLLAKKLKDEILREFPPRASRLYKDLFYETTADVNWMQIAQDLLLHY
jgi:chemotaxis protein MotB